MKLRLLFIFLIVLAFALNGCDSSTEGSRNTKFDGQWKLTSSFTTSDVTITTASGKMTWSDPGSMSFVFKGSYSGDTFTGHAVINENSSYDLTIKLDSEDEISGTITSHLVIGGNTQTINNDFIGTRL